MDKKTLRLMCYQVPGDEILRQVPLSSAPAIQSVNRLNLMYFVPYLIQHPATFSYVGKKD